MNVFNRIVVVVFLVGLVAVLVAGLWQPAIAVATLRYAVDSIEIALTTAPGIYIAWAVTGLLAFVAGLLIVLELRQPKRLTVTVRQSGGTTVELTTESVCRSLEYHVGQVPGVTQVRPVVTSKGKTVRIALDLETDPQMDVPAKSEEIIQLTRDLVEGKLGLKMAPDGLRVSVHQAPYGPATSIAPVPERLDAPGDLPLQGPAAS